MLLSTLIVLLGFGGFIYVVILIARSEREYDTTTTNTQIEQVQEEEVVEEKKYKYTDEEFDEAWELQVYLEEHNGELPNKGMDGLAILRGVASAAILWYLFYPLLAVWWGVNMFVPNPLRWMCWFMLPESVVKGNGGAFMIIVALLINLAIAFFAIYGLCARFLLFTRYNELHHAFKEYSGRMAEALDGQDEAWQKDLDMANDKLHIAEDKVGVLQIEKENMETLLKETEQGYKKQLSNMQEEFAREKRILELEKRELELELKTAKHHE